MTKERLQELLSVENGYKDVVQAISTKPAPDIDPLLEYNVDDHTIFDKKLRPDIWIKNEVGENVRERIVNRIGLALEQLITSEAAAFLTAHPIVYKSSPESTAEDIMLDAFLKVNEANKLDYKNQAILERRMSELEVAEIWYIEELGEDDDYWAGTELFGKKGVKDKIKLFIASPALKDRLYPIWNGQENLIGFARAYVVTEDDEKDVEHFDIYTEDFIYEGVKRSGEEWDVKPTPNMIKKITAIYHSQLFSEWHIVRPLIKRLEIILSNLADSNDKIMSPILFVEGQLMSLPDTLTGRVLQGTGGTKASYITADNAPEATRLEIDNLLRQIFLLTFTPEITLDSLKGIGTTSGFALEMMFMGAHLKASRHAGTFGECLQRRINLIKKMITVIDPSLKPVISLEIKPTFDLFLPKDVAGIINYLTVAVAGPTPIISQETAVNILQGALGGDAVQEFSRIVDETEAAAISPVGLNSLMNNPALS